MAKAKTVEDQIEEDQVDGEEEFEEAEDDGDIEDTAGHNSEAIEKAILNYYQESVQIDVERRRLMKRKGVARQKLKDMGMDTKAIDARYAYYKQKNHDRDGYDDAARISDEAMNKANTGDLFAPLYDVENV